MYRMIGGGGGPTPKSQVAKSAEKYKAKKTYGKFSTLQICFCGLDPGNLKFETVRTNKQHICF